MIWVATVVAVVCLVAFVASGQLVRSPRPESCDVCKLRSLTLGAPGLVRCDHREG